MLFSETLCTKMCLTDSEVAKSLFCRSFGEKAATGMGVCHRPVAVSFHWDGDHMKKGCAGLTHPPNLKL